MSDPGRRPVGGPPVVDPDELGEVLQAVQGAAPVGTVAPAPSGAQATTDRAMGGDGSGKYREDAYDRLVGWLGSQRHSEEAPLRRSANALHYANNVDTLKIIGPALKAMGGDVQMIELPTGRRDAEGNEITHWIAPRISNQDGVGHSNIMEAMMDAQEVGLVYGADGKARKATEQEKQVNAQRAVEAAINAAGPGRFGLDDAAWGGMTPEQRFEVGAPVLFDQAARATTQFLNPLFGVRQKIGRNVLQAIPYAIKSGDKKLLGELKAMLGEDVVNAMQGGGGGGGSNWFTEKTSPYGADGAFGSGIGKDMANWQHLAGYSGLAAGGLAAAAGMANSDDERAAYNAMAAAQAAGIN